MDGVRIILSVFLGALFIAASNDCLGDDSVASLRAEYARLRNLEDSSDGLVVRGKAASKPWFFLADRIQNQIAILRDKKGDDSAVKRLTLTLAALKARLARVFDDSDEAEQAYQLLSIFRSEAPKKDPDEYYVEALLLSGDLATQLGKSEDALKHYRSLRLFVKGDGEAILSHRLSSLRNGTFERFFPAPEVERPAVLALRRGGSRVPTLRKKVKTIVIDPGHGGDDSGAVGKGGLQESQITLSVAKLLQEELQRTGLYRAVLTRSEDEFVPLAKRTQKANHLKADLFLSLHVNASPSHKLSGFETYYLDNTDDQASRKLAERENGVAPGGGLDDLSFILSDLIQSAKLKDSIRLAHAVDSSLRSKVVSTHSQIGSKGVLKAPFFVLVGAHMPCALAELLFVDHHEDGRLLGSESFRRKLALALSAAVRDYFAAEAKGKSGRK